MPRKKVAHRRAPGDGTVRQRPDGRWEARYAGSDGQRHSVYGNTEAEVLTRLREQNHNRDLGLMEPSGGRLSFGQMLDLWLEHLKQSRSIRPSGWQAYYRIVHNHLKPQLGNVRLTRLSHHHLNKLYGDLEVRGLQSSTIRAIHGVAATSLKWARAESPPLLVSDPASLTKRLTRGRKRHHGLNLAQVVAMLRHLEGHHDQALFSLALLGGLRFGELAGLRWSDIDLDREELHVQQALSRITQASAKRLGLPEATFIQDPKTAKSDRFVLLLPEVVEHLRHHRLQQIRQFLAEGKEWKESGLVFLNEFLSPLRNSVINRRWHEMQTAIGIPREEHVRFHDTRGTAATMGSRAGDIRNLMERHGWTNANMAMHYTDADTQRGIVNHMERQLAEERAKTLREAK